MQLLLIQMPTTLVNTIGRTTNFLNRVFSFLFSFLKGPLTKLKVYNANFTVVKVTQQPQIVLIT